ncbi:MAG: threonine synthase, partial [Alphaproteobacteria bacterium]
MKYVSTRGEAPEAGFDDILLASLAGDGGLFIPAAWPGLSTDQIADLAGREFHEVAYRIIQPFVGGVIDDAALAEICRATYATFGHRAVAPLTQIAPGQWVLELFHGPTLAFKD